MTENERALWALMRGVPKAEHGDQAGPWWEGDCKSTTSQPISLH